MRGPAERMILTHSSSILRWPRARGSCSAPARSRCSPGSASYSPSAPTCPPPARPSPPTARPALDARLASGGLLTLRCTTSGYLYTAGQPGTTTLSASVRPRCPPGREHVPTVGDHSEPEDHDHVTGQPTGIP